VPVAIADPPEAVTPVTPGLGFTGSRERPKYVVRLPGWDDVVHLTPPSMMDPRELQARRKRAFDSLRHSPVPEVVQDAAKIAQSLDNIQDALVVLSVAGRVAVKLAPRLAPVVGPIALATDVLNAINIFYPGTLVKGAVGATTSAGRALSGRSKYVGSKESKRAGGALAQLSNGTYKQRLAETVRTGKVGFGWGEVLQVAQTTDWLFGAGLSLGPVFAVPGDVVFGLARGAEFDLTAPVSDVVNAVPRLALNVWNSITPWFANVTVPEKVVQLPALKLEWPGFIPMLAPAMGTTPEAIEAQIAKAVQPIKGPVHQAAAAVDTGVGYVKAGILKAAVLPQRLANWLVPVRGALTWEEHVELLLAEYLSLLALVPFLESRDWVALAERELRRPVVDVPRSVGTGGRSVPLAEMTARQRDRWAPEPLEWVEEVPAGPARDFARSLLFSYTQVLFRALEGPAAPVEGRSGPAGRAWLTMHDYDLLPPYERTPAELDAFTGALVALEQAYPERGRPSYAEVASAYGRAFPGVSIERARG